MSQDQRGFAEQTDGSVLVSWRKDGALLAVAGELDLVAASALREALSRVDEFRAGRALHLDLTGVTFADCSGWAPVAEAALRLRESGGSMEVVAASACVVRLLTLIDPGPVRLAEVGDAHAYG